MKKTLILAIASLFTLAVVAQTKPEDALKVDEVKHDFGKIKAGTPVSYYFELTNITDKPIVVENTRASCGCTTPEKPTEPIMPGKTGKVKVIYNAAAVAPFTKDVYVKIAGIQQEMIMHITGEVLSADAYEQYVKAKDSKPNN